MAEQDQEQRTEEATPRRRDEARDRGQVALSTELVAATGLASGVGVLAVGGTRLVSDIAVEVQNGAGSLATLGTQDWSVRQTAQILDASISGVGYSLALVVVPTILIGALTSYSQVGFRLTPKAIELDPNKLDPISGAKRLFSLRGVVRTALAAAKIALIVGSAMAVAWSHVGVISRVGTNELGPMLAVVGVVVLRTVGTALAAILALAVIDILFQRYQLARDLRMTKQEIKEEHRLTEGDPHVKARIRAVQREFAQRRMLADVPKATVVVTNPTHYAVALRYERSDVTGKRVAPVVVAKGVDHLAQRIKELARAAGVALHEDVPLARTLYARVKVGQEIPEELYAAVAAVLATVYRRDGTRTEVLT